MKRKFIPLSPRKGKEPIVLENLDDAEISESTRRNLKSAYHLFPKLMDICKYYRSYCYKSAEEFGLCASEIDIVIALYEDPRSNTVMALSKSVHLSKSVVSKSVESLRKRGYVSVLPGEVDKRYVMITLSEGALPIVESMSKSAERFIKQIGDGIDEKDLGVIAKFIAHIHSNTEKMKASEPIH